jgi:hypothetical protein
MHIYVDSWSISFIFSGREKTEKNLWLPMTIKITILIRYINTIILEGIGTKIID